MLSGYFRGVAQPARVPPAAAACLRLPVICFLLLPSPTSTEIAASSVLVKALQQDRKIHGWPDCHGQRPRRSAGKQPRPLPILGAIWAIQPSHTTPLSSPMALSAIAQWLVRDRGWPRQDRFRGPSSYRGYVEPIGSMCQGLCWIG